MCMFSEDEIRNWKQRELEMLESIVDPVENRCRRVAVAVLDGVIND